jgi:hypothetical protein
VRAASLASSQEERKRDLLLLVLQEKVGVGEKNSLRNFLGACA